MLFSFPSLVKTWMDDLVLHRYKGSYLLEAIDSIPPPVRDFSKPLVMPVSDVIRSSSTGQISACGKLESGAMRSGLKVNYP